jgi:hypothetical protein
VDAKGARLMTTALAAEEHTKPDLAAQDRVRTSDLPKYLRFAAMVATSTAVMFALTYTNVFVVDHIFWSEERFYMAMIMGGAMAIVMLGFMWHMYPNRTANIAILVVGFLFIALGLGLSRSQLFVGDSDYMKGMIPHHSIAILTSERADIRDVRVRELADGIIRTQREEIAEMKWLLHDIEVNGIATSAAQARGRPVPDFGG